MQQMIEAAAWRTQAENARETGDPAAAIEHLRKAAVLYTQAEAMGLEDHRAHGDVCRLLAELLAEDDRLPEAMQAYQEAVDAYEKSPGSEAESRQCARRIVEGVKRLRQRPEERLQLLIAQLDREQRQIAAMPESEMAQAESAFHIALVLHRRERYADAAPRYLDALALYRRAAGSERWQALCHFRLAGLYQLDLMDPRRAQTHYRAAVSLYRALPDPTDDDLTNGAECERMLRAIAAVRS